MKEATITPGQTNETAVATFWHKIIIENVIDFNHYKHIHTIIWEKIKRPNDAT